MEDLTCPTRKVPSPCKVERPSRGVPSLRLLPSRPTPGLRADGPRCDGEEKIKTITMVLIFRLSLILPPPGLAGSVIAPDRCVYADTGTLLSKPHHVEAVLPAAQFFLHQRTKKKLAMMDRTDVISSCPTRAGRTELRGKI